MVLRAFRLEGFWSAMSLSRAPAGMSGYHVDVWSAAMPPSVHGVWQQPGYIYFSSMPDHSAAGYEVYSALSIQRYPVPETAVYHGRVGAMLTPLPARPRLYEVCYYFANYAGTVDCYQWRPDFPDGLYVKFEVTDICSPDDWWRGESYVLVGLHWDTPITRRNRILGLYRFYRVMRAAE